MPTEFIPAQVQVEYVSELSTNVDSQQEAHIAPELPIHLVERSQFVDQTFWDILMGNYPRLNTADLKPGMDNPHVRYLTTDSVAKILKHREQFASGIDFQHLPAGFFLTKNPLGGGVCDVLHYSEYYAQFLPKDDNNVLAITLMTQDELTRESDDEPVPFRGAQATWYTFLQTKRVSNQGVYCTEEQLKNAFIRFSNIIQELGLDFDAPQFADCLLTQSFNPILLLGGWETVMRNPHLKRVDLKSQWLHLPQLALVNSHEAIRAITDYVRDLRPCGFLLDEMNLNKQSFLTRASGGFRSIDHFKQITGLDSFWRFIAYQPKRNSIEFYQKALLRINQMGLAPYAREKMVRILAASTTGLNHSENTSVNEEYEYVAWDALCKTILIAPSNVAMLGGSSQFTEEVTAVPGIKKSLAN